MTKFIRKDLLEIMPKEKARSLFTALRRYNLGTEKTVTITGSNRYGEFKGIHNVIEFDIEECLQFYTARLKYSTVANRNILKCWKNTIKQLNQLKGE